MAKKIKVILDLDNDGFVRGVKQAEQATVRAEKQFRSTGTAMGSIFGGLVGGAGIGMALSGLRTGIGIARDIASFMKESIILAGKQEQAEAGLQAALEERGHFTEEGFKRLKDYAGYLQTVTTSGDEVTLSVMRQIAQYGLYGKELERATKITLDMVASGKEMKGSSEMVARAFGGSFEMFSRYGGQMRDLIKQKAPLETILAEIETHFAKQAQARAATPFGQYEIAMNAMSDLKESFGEGLVQGISEVAKQLGISAEAMTKFVQANSELIALKTEKAVMDVSAAVRVMNAALTETARPLAAIAQYKTMWEPGGKAPSVAEAGRGVFNWLGANLLSRQAQEEFFNIGTDMAWSRVKHEAAVNGMQKAKSEAASQVAR